MQNMQKPEIMRSSVICLANTITRSSFECMVTLSSQFPQSPSRTGGHLVVSVLNFSFPITCSSSFGSSCSALGTHIQHLFECHELFCYSFVRQNNDRKWPFQAFTRISGFSTKKLPITYTLYHKSSIFCLMSQQKHGREHDALKICSTKSLVENWK